MGRKNASLTPFKPGEERMLVLPAHWGAGVRKVPAALPGTACEVELPSRLHASVIDMNRFGPGEPGGGGIGFGVGLYCRSKITLTEAGHVTATGNRPTVASHLGALFCKITGHRGGVEIMTSDHGRRHLGLGSSIATVTAVAVALNEAFGRPLTLRDLRKLVAFNYCEEAPGAPEMLVKGFETNIGAMVGIHGGMVVGSDRCELIYRVALPEEMKALLVIPEFVPGSSSGDAEASALLGKARAMDRKDKFKKAYKILLELLPAMVEGDYEAVGDAIYDLAFLGSKKAECMLHGDKGAQVFETMEKLRGQGAEIVSMSSVGPAVFALSSKPKVWKSWKGWVDGGALVVPVDNTGIKVRLDGQPIPYGLEPWWVKPEAGAKRLLRGERG